MVDAVEVKRRRGTQAQCDAMIPADGEIIIDSTNDTARVGDGLRSGGFIMPNFNHIQNSSFQFGVAGGTGNALTLTLYPAPLSYSQPLKIQFKASSTNSGPATIDVNGLGTRNIRKVSGGSISDLASGDILSGWIYEAVYDGTQFLLLTQTNAGIVSVSQGDLNTSTGTVSTTNIKPILLTLPGGLYGFYPQISGPYQANIHFCDGLIPGASYVSRISMNKIGSGIGSINARQNYITSSPPYDLGDGEVGGFIFAMVNSSGDIVSTYIADAPPWAYNGPTDIRCTHKCPITGKKFKRAVKKRSFEEIMDGAKIEYEMVEMTHEVKNADMDLIPHPFGDVPDGHSVVLLDPMSDKVARMIQYQNSGGQQEVSDYLANNVKIDNRKLNRRCHKSVTPVKFTCKRSGK